MSNRFKTMRSILINNLDPALKDHILNLNIHKDVLKKFDEEENRERVAQLIDLRDINVKTETEVYRTLNHMINNKQFFIYSGPLLLNINPGPNYVNDYLNLESWVNQNKGLSDQNWKPHLYSFVHFIYQTLIKEKKDQVINMLGQTGVGKTFNLVHILEYFCFLSCPENKQVEVFDVIHKSIQLIHMMSSIFRQNNMESSSSGLLISLGFDDNNKLCNFDFDSRILDFTLPFSENGRTFSILHALMIGANSEIKKILELPESMIHLNFFRKYLSSFNDKTKEKFRLNDYEVWTKFHSLLKFFNFSKSEVMEILQLMAFILLCNEANINKKKTKFGEELYVINRGNSSKKLAKNLGIYEDQFLENFGSYKNLNDMKNSLISLIKYSYYMIFEYIKTKIKTYLKSYFDGYKGYPLETKKNNHSFGQNSNIKYIHFIDTPGEVDDQTLGGLTSNLTNECLNVFAGSHYLSVVNKLKEEKLNIKYFQPLHSCYVIESLIGKLGMFKFLSNPFTEENYNKLRKIITERNEYIKTTKFNDELQNEFVFHFKYSHKVVPYSYESIYHESKSLHVNKHILKIFQISKNSIVKATLDTVTSGNKSLYSLALENIRALFKPLEGLSPFVIFCLHSNNSYRIFFGNHKAEFKNNWLLPPELTQNILKNSLTIPILFWEWFGYHEWVKIKAFIREFFEDFENIKNELVKDKRKNVKDINLKNLNDYELCTYILSVVTDKKQYFLGSHHIIMKRGTLDQIRNTIKNLLPNNRIDFKIPKISRKGTIDNNKTNTNNTNNSKKKVSFQKPYSNITRSNSSKKGIISKNSVINENQNETKEKNTSSSLPPTKKLSNSSIEPPVLRKRSLKVQCHLDILDEIDNENKMIYVENVLDEIIESESSNNNYNLFYILKNNPKEDIDISYINHENENMDDEFSKYKKDNNIIVPTNKQFTDIRDLLDNTKFNNFSIFDYNEFNQEIIKIQSTARGYKARKKYKIYRYVLKRIVLMQKIARGYIIRRKFTRFLYLLRCVKIIQSAYKRRFKRMWKNALKIQNAWRGKLAYNKLLQIIEQVHYEHFINEQRKLEQLRNEQELLEEYEINYSSINESVYKVSNRELENEVFGNSITYNKNKQVEALLKAEFNKKKKVEKSKRLKEISKVNLPQHNKKDGPLMVIKPKNRMSMMELEAETDKNKIIDCLLNDTAVNNVNISKVLRNSANNSTLNNTKINKFFENKENEKKIEDRLIEYGEIVKQRKDEKRIENIKSEEKSLSFKPDLTKPNINNSSFIMDMNKYGGDNFLNRMNTYKINKDKNMDKIKLKIGEDTDKEEYTFKPKINPNNRKKRTIEDLFEWKNQKNENYLLELKKKEIIEENMLKELKSDVSKINKNSQLILKQKSEKLSLEENQDDEEYDLWPEVKKNYFEKQ